VIFESGLSLQTMIEGMKVDFDLYVVDFDVVLTFPGYSISILADVDDFIRLVKSDRNEE
jgi:hypothetical protein